VAASRKWSRSLDAQNASRLEARHGPRGATSAGAWGRPEPQLLQFTARSRLRGPKARGRRPGSREAAPAARMAHPGRSPQLSGAPPSRHDDQRHADTSCWTVRAPRSAHTCHLEIRDDQLVPPRRESQTSPLRPPRPGTPWPRGRREQCAHPPIIVDQEHAPALTVGHCLTFPPAQPQARPVSPGRHARLDSRRGGGMKNAKRKVQGR
jgi:hypothetical protein